MTSRLSRNDGFSTVAIMVTMMLSSLLAVAAFATANNGTPLSRSDQNQKQAYSAAEAGVAYYAAHVAQDPNYWTYCTDPPSAPTPNPLWDGVTGSRTWRDVPSTDIHPAQYSIRLIAPPGSTKCQSGLAASTFLNPLTGTFSIMSTGKYRGHTRSIIATFKRKGFVDFLWFTNFETADPITYQPVDQANAIANCQQFNRAVPATPGHPATPGRPSFCHDQTFPGFDSMLGPMHTNDRFLTCNQPVFGATANDVIESVDPNEFETGGGCTPGTRGAGTKQGGRPPLDFPPTNTDLANDTLFNWTFTGQTSFQFFSAGAGSVLITNAALPGACHCATRALPANNVIYVKNGNCTSLYQEAQRYTPQAGCGDATIKGDYPVSMTVGADNDIIINGDLKRSDPAAEMGLIANGFIRVYHPIVFSGTECDSNSPEASNALPVNLEIDAAILSLRHSFMVDNPGCGDPRGSLTVDGAIAQWFRGTVGTFNSSGNLVTGYSKHYIYDQHLRYADPPYFLDPVETSWNVVRQTEKVPAEVPPGP